MKKILILFFFICTCISFAEYEDLYNVIEEKEKNKIQFTIEKYNSRYMVINFLNEEDAKECFEDTLLTFNNADFIVTDIYEHKILGYSGYFTVKAIRTDDNTKKKFMGAFWSNNSVRIISFSNHEEAKNLSKYLDINKKFSSINENFLIQELIQKAFTDGF